LIESKSIQIKLATFLLCRGRKVALKLLACKGLPGFEEEQEAVKTEEDDEWVDEAGDEWPVILVEEERVERERVISHREEVILHPQREIAQRQVL